jgi:hypothetical protein
MSVEAKHHYATNGDELQMGCVNPSHQVTETEPRSHHGHSAR